MASAPSFFSFNEHPSLPRLLRGVTHELAWIALFVLLGLTILGYCVARLQAQRDVTDSMRAEASQSISTIKARLDISAQVLHSTAAMLMLNRTVQRDTWLHYQQNLSRQGWPDGMTQLGYAQRIAFAEKVALSTAMRADAAANYQIYPPRDHGTHVPILFIAPESDTPGIGRLGFDLLSVPAVQQALAQATDTGAIAFHSVQLSDKLQADQQPIRNQQVNPTHAFLVLPLFPGNAVPPTASLRQEQVIGYVFGLLKINDFLQSIDATRYRPVRLIESADHETRNALERGGSSAEPFRTIPLDLFGSDWRVSFMTPPTSTGSGGGANAIAISGTIISLLIFAIFRLLATIQLESHSRSRLTSREIRQLQHQLAALIACSDQAVIMIDRRQRIMTFNSAAEVIFSVRSATAVGMPISRFLPYRLRGAKRVETIGNLGVKLSMYRLHNAVHELACRYHGERFPFDATIFKCGRWGQQGYLIVLKELTIAVKPDLIPAIDIGTSMLHQPTASPLSHSPSPISAADIAGVGHFEISVGESVCDASFEWLGDTPSLAKRSIFSSAPATDQPRVPLQMAQQISIKEFINNYIHADDRAAVKQQWKQAFRSGSDVDCVYRMLLSDGRAQQVRHWMTQVAMDGNVRRFAGVFHALPQMTAPTSSSSILPAEDARPPSHVDERRRWQPGSAETGRLYQQLQCRIMTFESAREEQQKRLAREMHDDFGQLLTAMKMDLIVLQGQLTKVDHRLSQQLGDVSDLVDAMVVSVRRIIANLPPQNIDQHGLVKSLELMADAHAKRHRISCRLQVQARLSPLDEVIVTPIYRIVQEALNNVAKHARYRDRYLHRAAPRPAASERH